MVEKLRNSFFLKLFLFRKLPLALIAGLKVLHFDDNSCVTSMPYGWMTKNPFRSMYFAAQSMAAEFSTAVPGVKAIEDSGRSIAMIIVHLEADFVKKATSRVTFTCEDCKKFTEGIDECVRSGEAVTVEGRSEGRDENGEVVSVFRLTWSFKLRA